MRYNTTLDLSTYAIDPSYSSFQTISQSRIMISCYPERSEEFNVYNRLLTNCQAGITCPENTDANNCTILFIHFP